ncbi:CesT family type III secretion system chaperone [Thalassomonas actiniarum]|uniref:Type III secretion system chaperone n=1 Tax=Thalassomonas actiniarum TaxID=485447 RepID=A0AAF0BWD8_9GAMM|nr:CesT family type III secretion system chaperone [Thalassomonas actiniarum]WDD96606.1 type III secretion system chaperone [Thalassomonas actiniarum]
MQVNQAQLEIIKLFAKQLGYENSADVDDKGFALVIDNKVQINILNQEERCHLIAYLAPIKEENRIELYETLLLANHNQDELAGASLGICPKKKAVALSFCLESEGLELSRLQQAFDNLLDHSLLWHTLLNDNEAQPLPGEEQPLSSHAILV